MAKLLLIVGLTIFLILAFPGNDFVSGIIAFTVGGIISGLAVLVIKFLLLVLNQ